MKTYPLESCIILSIPLGPKLLLTTYETAIHASILFDLTSLYF